MHTRCSALILNVKYYGVKKGAWRQDKTDTYRLRFITATNISGSVKTLPFSFLFWKIISKILWQYTFSRWISSEQSKRVILGDRKSKGLNLKCQMQLRQWLMRIDEWCRSTARQLVGYQDDYLATGSAFASALVVITYLRHRNTPPHTT